MICEDMQTQNGGIVFKNYYGEWQLAAQTQTPASNILSGGPYDGVSLDNLPDGTIVYVGGTAEDAATYESAQTDTTQADDSADDLGDDDSASTDVDLDAYPEFDGIKYFKPYEFFCKCSNANCVGKTSVHMSHELLVVADRMRERFGAPVTVTSGIRCPSHNAAVGGVSGSRHLSGKAMDFVIDGETAWMTTNWAATQPEIRYTYAITSTATHMDVT